MQAVIYPQGGYYWFNIYNLPEHVCTPRSLAEIYDTLDPESVSKLQKVCKQLPCAREYMIAHADEYGWDAPMIEKATIYTARELPRPIEYFHEFNRCWQNSFAYAERTGVRYVEGLAISPAGAFLHAWNSTDGEDVLDFSWPCQQYNKYFGFDFDIEWMRENGFREGGLVLHHQEMYTQGKKLLFV